MCVLRAHALSQVTVTSHAHTQVNASYLELYNEQPRDLLRTDGPAEGQGSSGWRRLLHVVRIN